MAASCNLWLHFPRGIPGADLFLAWLCMNFTEIIAFFLFIYVQYVLYKELSKALQCTFWSAVYAKYNTMLHLYSSFFFTIISLLYMQNVYSLCLSYNLCFRGLFLIHNYFFTALSFYLNLSWSWPSCRTVPNLQEYFLAFFCHSFAYVAHFIGLRYV